MILRFQDQDMDEDDDEEFLEKFNNQLTLLTGIWKKIGIDVSSQRKRKRVVHIHIMNLLEQMYAEENEWMTKLQHNISNFQMELNQLCRELYCPPDNVSLLLFSLLCCPL